MDSNLHMTFTTKTMKGITWSGQACKAQAVSFPSITIFSIVLLRVGGTKEQEWCVQLWLEQKIS